MKNKWVKITLGIIGVIVVVVIINSIYYAYYPESAYTTAYDSNSSNVENTAASSNWWTINIRIPVIRIGTNGFSIKIPAPAPKTNNAASK